MQHLIKIESTMLKKDLTASASCPYSIYFSLQLKAFGSYKKGSTKNDISQRNFLKQIIRSKRRIKTSACTKNAKQNDGSEQRTPKLITNQKKSIHPHQRKISWGSPNTTTTDSSVHRELESESFGPWFNYLINLKKISKGCSANLLLQVFMAKLAFTVALFTLAKC